MSESELMKLYIVCEIGYEYNDEYYEKAEGNDPVKAYRSREKAEKEVMRLNIDYVTRPSFDKDLMVGYVYDSETDTEEYRTITDWYTVKEIEVNERDILED